MQLNSVVLCLLVSMIAAVPQARKAEPPRRQRISFMNAAQTSGGTTTVMDTPPKDPLRLPPKLVMQLAEPKKGADGNYVCAVGYFAWKDGGDIIINVQTFWSPDEPSKGTQITEIMRLPRKTLLSTKLGARGYRLKELDPLGLAEFSARLIVE